MPISLTEVSEPEPDISVALGVICDLADHHPRASEIILLVEVADDTLVKDRSVKRAFFASAGIQDYWIVNLMDSCIEVYRQPSSDGTYPDVRICLANDSIELISVPGKTIAVSDLLPLLFKDDNESI